MVELDEKYEINTFIIVYPMRILNIFICFMASQAIDILIKNQNTNLIVALEGKIRGSTKTLRLLLGAMNVSSKYQYLLRYFSLNQMLHQLSD